MKQKNPERERENLRFLQRESFAERDALQRETIQRREMREGCSVFRERERLAVRDREVGSVFREREEEKGVRCEKQFSVSENGGEERMAVREIAFPFYKESNLPVIRF